MVIGARCTLCDRAERMQGTVPWDWWWARWEPCHCCDICHRPPSQEWVGKDFFRQLEEAFYSQALVLVGGFNHSNVNWKVRTAGHRQSRRTLDSVDGNFLTQVIKKLVSGDALLNIIGRLGVALAAVAVKWWSLGSSEQRTKGKKRSPLFTSGEQIPWILLQHHDI